MAIDTRRQRRQKRLHRVVLRFPFGLTHSVFIRAYTRTEAEKLALRRHPEATGIDHTPFPLS